MKRRKCPATGKVQYRDEIGARVALAKLVRQDEPGHTERRAYRCPVCGRWHLTSQERGASGG